MASFTFEREGNVAGGLSLLHPEFRSTEMNIGPDGTVFRSLAGSNVRNLIRSAFQISDREYEIVHVLADEEAQVVMVEFVESYTDTVTGKRYRTPIVAVCVVRDGKIYRTRHYTDDRLSDLYLDTSTIDGVLG